MPVAGSSIVAGVLDRTIVVVGSGGTNRTDVYDIRTNTWHDGVPMPAQRGSMAGAVANGGLWVVGGTINGLLAHDTWVYYPATDTRAGGWGGVGSMPTARWGLAAAVLNDVVYAIGGAANSSGAILGLATNESLSTPPFGDLSTSQGSSGNSDADSAPTVQWLSRDPAVADVDANGFVNPRTLGQTTIVASVGSLSGEATFIVSNAAPTVRITGRLGGPLPLPPFAPGPFGIDEGSQLQLNAEASDSDFDPLTYTWSIVGGTGTFDGQGGNTSSSSLSYTNGDGPSSATIQVVVTDSLGATATATTTIAVNNSAPIVTLFGSSQSISEGGFQSGGNLGGGNFFDVGTVDGPWTATVNYGDGTPVQTLSYTASSGGFAAFGNFSLNHTYGDNGSYTVAVTVTDKDDATGSATRSVTVNNVAPQVFLPNAVSTSIGNTGTLGCASFLDPGSADGPWTATVNYGDGSNEETVPVNVPGSCGGGGSTTGSFGLGHVYVNGGTYTITVSVRDKDQGVGTATTQVSVNAPPRVTIDSPAGPINEGSTFNGSGSFMDGSSDGPWTISVNFGDNSGQPILPQTSSPFTFSHLYKDNGTYTVTVQVMDRFFATGSASITVTVNNVAPSVSLPASVGPINEGQSMSISVGFSDPGKNDSQSAGFKAVVNYGDGTPIQYLGNLSFGSGTGQGSFSLNHTYVDNPVAPATTFTLTVTVIDKDGGTSIAATVPVTVLNTAPRPTLSTGSIARHGYPASFSGGIADQGANDAPWSGTVNYGDGTPTETLTLSPGGAPNSLQNTRAIFTSTHTYAQSGSFTVTLTATDKDGFTGSATSALYVEPVLVSIAVTPGSATMNAAGQTVLFNATATFSDGGTFDSNGQVIEGATWSSSNTNVATVGLGGLTTAVGPGIATITLVGEDDLASSFSASAVLTVDFAPPLITGDDVSAEATSAAGAAVSFSFAATDDLDPHPAVSADRVSGATFPIGTTNVIVTAVDAAGNSSTKTLHVGVVDTTKPVMTLIGANPMTVEGTTFIDPGATAVDVVAGDLTARIQIAGAVDTHVVGSYTLTYSVSDGFNATTRTRLVNVVDGTPPVLSLPANLTADATAPGGAVVNFTASASDVEGGIRPVSCAPESGSMFAIGTTIVSCSASDANGNTARGAFTVTVLGSEQIIANLIAQVGALDFRQASNLLGNVFASLNRANTGAACNQLEAFISQVEARRNKTLTDAEATALIGSAAAVRGTLACQ
jgi:hypothetical protein